MAALPSPLVGLVVPGACLHVNLNDPMLGMLEDDVSLACAVDVREHLTALPGCQEIYPLLREISEPAAVNGSLPSCFRLGIQNRGGSENRDYARHRALLG